MNKIWRIVSAIALILVALGILLLGAAWLTGASVSRIVEMVFGGQAELDAWFHAGLDRAQALWTAALEQIKAIL